MTRCSRANASSREVVGTGSDRRTSWNPDPSSPPSPSVGGRSDAERGRSREALQGFPPERLVAGEVLVAEPADVVGVGSRKRGLPSPSFAIGIEKAEDLAQDPAERQAVDQRVVETP